MLEDRRSSQRAYQLDVWEPSRHVVGVGGQTLFAAGLPTFRGECRVDSVPLAGFACSLLAVAALGGRGIAGRDGRSIGGTQPGVGSWHSCDFCGGSFFRLLAWFIIMTDWYWVVGFEHEGLHQLDISIK